MIDEEGEECLTVYLARKAGLSGGWRGFSIDHGLVDGDALVFQLIRPLTFKVRTATLKLPNCRRFSILTPTETLTIYIIIRRCTL